MCHLKLLVVYDWDSQRLSSQFIFKTWIIIQLTDLYKLGLPNYYFCLMLNKGFVIEDNQQTWILCSLEIAVVVNLWNSQLHTLTKLLLSPLHLLLLAAALSVLWSMILEFAFHRFCCCSRKCLDRLICRAESSQGFYLKACCCSNPKHPARWAWTTFAGFWPRGCCTKRLRSLASWDLKTVWDRSRDVVLWEVQKLQALEIA